MLNRVFGGPHVAEALLHNSAMPDALELKEQGAAAMKAKDFKTAIQCYSDAIQLNPDGEVSPARPRCGPQ